MNKLPRTIFLMGNRNAGKSVIASYLSAKYHVTPRGFADPLYEQLAILNPWIHTGISITRAQHEQYRALVWRFGVDYVKRNFVEVRKWLQLLGTECGRDVHGEDCWVKIAEERSRGDYATAFFDTRFKNEVKWGRSTPDPLFLHVWSDREEPQSDHRSEIQLDYAAEADYTLSNNGTLEELYDAVEDVLHQWATQHN
jgi:hypothetical protein